MSEYVYTLELTYRKKGEADKTQQRLFASKELAKKYCDKHAQILKDNGFEIRVNETPKSWRLNELFVWWARKDNVQRRYSLQYRKVNQDIDFCTYYDSDPLLSDDSVFPEDWNCVQ